MCTAALTVCSGPIVRSIEVNIVKFLSREGLRSLGNDNIRYSLAKTRCGLTILNTE